MDHQQYQNGQLNGKSSKLTRLKTEETNDSAKKNGSLHKYDVSGYGTSDDEGILFSLNFPVFAVITVMLPAGSLFVCIFTAIAFQSHDIHETSCRVYNVIPSISAVTGITPQAYLWRVCIALHSTPRFCIAYMYLQMYRRMIGNIEPRLRGRYSRLVKVNFVLNVIENGCLTLVTYISNKENYPVHEKIFVVFMFSSLLYMLLNTWLYRWSRPAAWSQEEKSSYRWKQFFLAGILMATAGLLYFFYLHRRYCQPLAWSLFAVSEYFVVAFNISYHGLCGVDFHDKVLLATTGSLQVKRA